MAITHRVDDKKRQLWVVADGSTTGAQIPAFSLELFQARPDLLDYDYVFDLRLAGGDATHGDIKDVAATFATRPPVQTHTVFITHDPSFGLWARAMDFQFQTRKHHVVRSPEEAEELLRTLRPGMIEE